MIQNLEKRKIKVTINTNKQILVNYGVTAKEVLRLLEMDTKDILAARINNRIRNLDHMLYGNCDLEPIKYDSMEGNRIYIRSVKFILNLALKKLYPEMNVEVCNITDNDIYFICENYEFTNDMAVEILKEMRTLVADDVSFERKVLNYEQAKYLFETTKDKRELENLSYRTDTNITIYVAGDNYGIVDGVIVPSASYTPNFNIKKFRRGFVLMMPDGKDIDKLDNRIVESPLYKVFEERTDFLDVIKVRSVYELNKKVIDGDMEDIIRVSEAEHNRKFAELLQDIEKKGHKKIILVAGPSASGKTTFSKRLTVNLRLIGYNPIVISMDNYFKERVDTPLQENGEYDFETVDALDLKLFNKDMKNLFNGKKINMPEFNFVTGCKEYPGNFLKLGEKDVLIVEGIHALNPLILKDVDDKLKYKIYIAPMTTLNVDDYSKVSTTDTRMLRRILRDYTKRGNDVEKTLSMWANLMKGESKYITPYIKYADYIFNTSYVYEIGAIRTFVEPLLLKVDSTSKYFSETRRLCTFIQKFLPIETTEIPADSIIREFIGKSSFSR